VDLLIGNPEKIRAKLGWKPRVNFRGLVEMMVKEDLKRQGVSAVNRLCANIRAPERGKSAAQPGLVAPESHKSPGAKHRLAPSAPARYAMAI
jgi:hypothetical protein